MTSSSRSRLGRTLLLIGRLALAAIFIIAAIEKMRPQPGMDWSLHSINLSLLMFSWVVDSYQILPSGMVTLFAQVLPPFELFLGLWLLSGIALRLSSLVSTLLMCMFVTALASAVERNLGINCGCFGQGVQVAVKTELMRVSGLFLPLAAAVTIGAFLLHRKPRASDDASVSAPVPQRAE
jgi:putative oxidoreductase